MQAHIIKYGTKVIVTDKKIKTSPSSPQVHTGDIVAIHKLDGMYCNGVNKDGNKIYIAAWTEVEPCV